MVCPKKYPFDCHVRHMRMALLLMAEKGIRGGICHAIHRYAAANNKYMKNYDKNKESSYLKYSEVNSLDEQCLRSYL